MPNIESAAITNKKYRINFLQKETQRPRKTSNPKMEAL
jgi:hypothetical protein